MAIIGSLFFGHAGYSYLLLKALKSYMKTESLYMVDSLRLYDYIGIVFSGGLWRSSVSINWLLIQDLRYVMYTAIGFAFANKP